MTTTCALVNAFWLYIAAGVGATAGFAVCAWLTINRDSRDEHEEFPGC